MIISKFEDLDLGDEVIFCPRGSPLVVTAKDDCFCYLTFKINENCTLIKPLNDYFFNYAYVR